MKNLLMGLVLTATTAAFAQSSSTQLPASSTQPGATATSSIPTATPGTPVQTMKTELGATDLSRFGGNIIFEANAKSAALKEQGGSAMVDSANAVGLTYKITDKIKTEIRHNFQLRSVGDREQLKKVVGKKHVVDPKTGQPGWNPATGEATMAEEVIYEDPYKTLDPTIHLNFTTEQRLMGSKPLSISNRYYIPVSEASQNNKSLGTLRTTVIPSWDITPKVSFDYLAETRFGFNSAETPEPAYDNEAREKLGADSTFRFLTGPGMTYNFSDSVNAYYIAYLDLITTGHQRGDFQKAERRNELNQEIGVSMAFGGVTVNPYWSTTATRAEGKDSYEGAGADENSAYNLLLQASF